MSLGTPAVNLHAPGPIGDGTPGPLHGTTLGINNTLTIDASVTGFGVIDVSPAGFGDLQIKFGGTGYYEMGANGYQFPYRCTLGNANIVANTVIFGAHNDNRSGIGNGGASDILTLMTGSTDRVILSNTLFYSTVPVKLPSYTVATLPSAATVGAGTKAFVTDLLTPVALATAVGGGAVGYDVVSDGTNWKVG